MFDIRKFPIFPKECSCALCMSVRKRAIFFSTDCLKGIGKTVKSFNFITSVCPSAWNNWAPTGRILLKFGIWLLLENVWRKFKFCEILTRMTCTLHDELCSFMITSASFLLSMRHISDKLCTVIYLNINQLDALNFIMSFISCLYMFRTHVLIVRSSKFYYTASVMMPEAV